MALRTPERIGKYEIVRQIGRGGMGTVYEGRDPMIDRSVAIKVLDTDDGSQRDRFLSEAQIAGGLQHPNIVTIFDYGVHEQTPSSIPRDCEPRSRTH